MKRDNYKKINEYTFKTKNVILIISLIALLIFSLGLATGLILQ